MTSKRTAVGRGGPWSVLVGLVVALAAMLVAIGSTAPAQAHSGGKAVVLVRNLTLAPVGDAWQANLALADLDSGTPIIAADAKITAGSAAPVALVHSESQPGVYTAKIAKLAPGTMDVRLVVRTFPGGPPVEVFDKTYPSTTVTAGQETVVTAAATGGDGGSNTGMIVGVAGAVLLVALLYGLFTVRRRGAVPARAK